MNHFSGIFESNENNKQNFPDYSILSSPDSFFINENEIFSDISNENNFPFNMSNKDISDISGTEKIEVGQNIQIEIKSTETKTIMNNHNSLKDINTILGEKCRIIDDIIKNKEDGTYLKIENNIKFTKKNIRKTFNEKQLEKNEITPKFKRGRKLITDTKKRKHNKTSADNIIKKIKGLLIRYLEKFVNNFINDEEKKLRHIDYDKYIKNIKKDSELELMQKKIGDILSSEISPKNTKKNLKSDHNKKIIEMLENNKNNKLFNFVLNLRFIDWIHIFTLEEKYLNFKDFSQNYYKEIKNYIPNIENLFNYILDKNKNDKIYFLNFIYLLYNYENYFVNKVGRIRKNK